MSGIPLNSELTGVSLPLSAAERNNSSEPGGSKCILFRVQFGADVLDPNCCDQHHLEKERNGCEFTVSLAVTGSLFLSWTRCLQNENVSVRQDAHLARSLISCQTSLNPFFPGLKRVLSIAAKQKEQVVGPSRENWWNFASKCIHAERKHHKQWDVRAYAVVVKEKEEEEEEKEWKKWPFRLILFFSLCVCPFLTLSLWSHKIYCPI